METISASYGSLQCCHGYWISDRELDAPQFFGWSIAAAVAIAIVVVSAIIVVAIIQRHFVVFHLFLGPSIHLFEANAFQKWYAAAFIVGI